MTEITDQEFFAIRDYIKQLCGINLGDEKKSLIHSRLSPILKESGFDTFGAYFAHVKTSREALVQFIDKVTTNHTYFMREPDHFDIFRDEALPYVETRFGGSKDLRVWCAGCSSGEEAYTLQMVAKDYFRGKPGWNTEILATDISTAVLTRAVRGVYSDESLKMLPERWKSEYMRRLDAFHHVMRDEIKRDVTFRKLNFMDRLTFTRPFQAVFCRNVMIYFDSETRAALVKKFYDCLEPGGFFFVGHSESLGTNSPGFKSIGPAAYRKAEVRDQRSDRCQKDADI